jgi:Na+-transporting NADH:ubiquinone oxidoreductase subunit C
MAKKKRILYPVVFMIVVTICFTFLLAFINEITIDTIEEQEALRVKKSVLYTFGFQMFEEPDEKVHAFFDDNITIETVDSTNVYIFDDGQLAGYAFEFSGKGLWGVISGHIALSPSHDRILGINFTNHQETPGLGGRIDEYSFKEQFTDLTFNLSQVITLNKATGGNVDAISGATLTSLAVRDIVNAELPDIIDFAVKEGFYEGN